MKVKSSRKRRARWLSIPENREKDRQASRDRYHRRKARHEAAKKRGELPL